MLNNQAAIDVATENYESAYQRLQKGLKIVPQEEEHDRLLLLQSMGTVCYFRQQQEEAKRYWQEALEIARKLYGEAHPVTIELKQNLEL